MFRPFKRVVHEDISGGRHDEKSVGYTVQQKVYGVKQADPTTLGERWKEGMWLAASDRGGNLLGRDNLSPFQTGPVLVSRM